MVIFGYDIRTPSMRLPTRRDGSLAYGGKELLGRQLVPKKKDELLLR